jgi:tripartite-type tricarboxylate transporter receptor subunit TctC
MARPPKIIYHSTSGILAQRLTERVGQSFLVENRTGASGIIGTEYVAKSAPDGYTLLVGSQTTQAVVPAMYKVSYDTARDIIARLNAEAVGALNVMEVKDRMAAQGLFVVASTPEQFSEFLKKEIPRWAKIVKDAGVKPQ